MIDKEEQARLQRLAREQKTPVTTLKSKQSGGLAQFLKKDDPNLEDLKKKYFDSEA